MMKFRVLHGMTIANHPTDKMPNGEPVQVGYHAQHNPIIETETDLEARFNSPGSRKFERIHEGQPVHSERTWDPDKETIEQFVTRMKAVSTPQIQMPVGWTKEDVQKLADSEEIPFEDALTIVQQPKVNLD